MLITGIGESVDGLAHLVAVRGAHAAQNGSGQDAESQLRRGQQGCSGRPVMEADRVMEGTLFIDGKRQLCEPL